MSVNSVKGFRLTDGSTAKYDYAYLENIITDKELTEEDVAADGKAVGDAIEELEAELSDLETDLSDVKADLDELSIYGSENISPTRETSLTTQGITFTPLGDGSYKVNGTTPSNANAHYGIFSNNSAFPTGIKAGDRLYGHVESTNNVIIFAVTWWVNGVKIETEANNIREGFKTFDIPTNATGMEIRITVPKNTTITNDVIKPFLFIDKTKNAYNEEISNINSEIATLSNSVDTGRIPYNVVWEYGNIDASGADEAKSYRVRTNGYISSVYNQIDVNNSAHNYYTYVYYYDSNHDFVQRVSYLHTANVNYSVDIDDTYPYYRIAVLDYINSSYSEPIDVNAVASVYSVTKESRTLREINNIKKDIIDIPSYYETQINTVTTAIKSHSGMIGKDGISFAFITDLHWGNNSKKSPTLIASVIKDTNVNNVIMGGDYIAQYSNSKQMAIDVMRSCINAFKDESPYVYALFGNHDRNTNGTASGVYMTKAESFEVINKWMNPVAQYGDAYFNFYIDDTKSKTRIICIDTGAQTVDEGGLITTASQNWIVSKINELTSDWHIVVVAHWLFSPTTWNNPKPNGVLTGQFTPSAQVLFGNLDAINADNSKPTVEAIITGHLHCDANLTTSGGIPVVWTDTDSLGAYGDYTATVGTISEQCFDVYGIDYTNKVIYCDRVGRGVSRSISY